MGAKHLWVSQVVIFSMWSLIHFIKCLSGQHRVTGVAFAGSFRKTEGRHREWRELLGLNWKVSFAGGWPVQRLALMAACAGESADCSISSSSDGPASSSEATFSIASAASHTATAASTAAASQRTASTSSSASLFAFSKCDSESLVAFTFWYSASLSAFPSWY